MRPFPEHTKRGDFRLFPRLGPRDVCEHLAAESVCSSVPVIAIVIEMLEDIGSPSPRSRCPRGCLCVSDAPWVFFARRHCGRHDDSEAALVERLLAHLALLGSAQESLCGTVCFSQNEKGDCQAGVGTLFPWRASYSLFKALWARWSPSQWLNSALVVWKQPS